MMPTPPPVKAPPSLYQPHSRLRGDCGLGKFTVMFFGPLLFIVFYCAYHIVPFYYYYFELVNQMQSHIEVAGVNTDKELREKLNYHIEKLGIPVDPGELIIRRAGNRILFRLRYKEVFYIPWRGRDIDIKVFPFDAQAEGEYEVKKQ